MDPASHDERRLVTAGRVDDERQYEAGLRPRSIDEYVFEMLLISC